LFGHQKQLVEKKGASAALKRREYMGKYRLLERSDQRELWFRTCTNSMDEEGGNM
jgi:hypothetical protein